MRKIFLLSLVFVLASFTQNNVANTETIPLQLEEKNVKTDNSTIIKILELSIVYLENRPNSFAEVVEYTGIISIGLYQVTITPSFKGWSIQIAKNQVTGRQVLLPYGTNKDIDTRLTKILVK